uniref:dolichyl-P-Glc:Man9GlcNAc2-PP-dolichol alpha-1,3-glucosyltransferase n=1 Tax=Phaeomonas parva TaxID=124430 RepID=A0A7S1XQQ6_9STRA
MLQRQGSSKRAGSPVPEEQGEGLPTDDDDEEEEEELESSDGGDGSSSSVGSISSSGGGGLMVWLLVAMVGLALRHFVSLYPHSGRHNPPMYGDYEAQRHWMEVTWNLPVRDWYFDTPENDLQYWGLDYPPLSAFFALGVGRVSAWFEPASVELGASRGYDTPAHRAFMRASVYLTDLVVYLPAALLLARLLFPEARVSTGRGARTLDANLSARRLSAAAMVFCPSLLLIDHGHFQYNGVGIGLALAAAACLLASRRWLACVLFSLSLNFKQMALFYAPVFGCVLLGWCLGQERGAGTDAAVDNFERADAKRQALLRRALRMYRQGYDMPDSLAEFRMPLPRVRRFLSRVVYLGAFVVLTFGALNLPFCIANAPDLRGQLQVLAPAAEPLSWNELLLRYQPELPKVIVSADSREDGDAPALAAEDEDEVGAAHAPANETAAAAAPGEMDDSSEQDTPAEVKPSWVSTVVSTLTQAARRCLEESTQQVNAAASSAYQQLDHKSRLGQQYASTIVHFSAARLETFSRQLLLASSDAALRFTEAMGLSPPGTDVARGCVAGVQQVAHRVFPIARGLFEDKVANFWYVLSIPLDVRNSVDESRLALLALLATLAALLPLIYLLLRAVPSQPVALKELLDEDEEKWKAQCAAVDGAIANAGANPIERRELEHEKEDLLAQRSVLVASGRGVRPSPRGAALVLALIASALACFLFGFQVHEKSILLAAVPLAALLPLDAGVVFLASSFLCFSMYPLLEKDGLTWAYGCLQAMLLGVALMLWSLDVPSLVPLEDYARKAESPSAFRGVLAAMRGKWARMLVGAASVLGMVAVHVLHATVPAPAALPHIYPLLYSVSSFGMILLLHVYVLVWLCALVC